MAPAPRLLISAASIRRRVSALGRAVSREAPDGLVVVGILRGSFIFLADLVRAIRRPLYVDFMKVSSYSGIRSSGRPRVDLDLARPLAGRHVLVVEDIVDTGVTLDRVLRRLRARRPASLKVAALLHKPSRAKVPVPLDYVGFTIPDVFVVGYGLDHDGRHRNLPYVGVLKP